MRRLVVWLAATLGAMTTTAELAAQAPPQTPQIEAVRVGFAGRYKVGFWTPVRIDCAGLQGVERWRLELVAPDSDGLPVVYQGPVRTGDSANGTTTAIEYVKFGRLRGGLTVRLLGVDDSQPPAGAASSSDAAAGSSGNTVSNGSDRTLVERRLGAGELGAAIGPHQPLLVSLGGDVGLNEAARAAFSASEPPIAAAVDDPADLPDRWFGYESVHTLVLIAGRSEWLDRVRPEQAAAVDVWLRSGGRLVVSTGLGARSMVERGKPWTGWLPGRFENVVPLRRTGGIETYATAEQRIGDGVADVRLDFASFADVTGRIDAVETLATQDERALVARYPVGLGQAVFVAIDVAQPEIAGWSGRSRLLGKILQNERATQQESAARESQGQVSHLGFDDLAGQLRSALEQFSGVTAVAFGWIVTIVVIYILLVGPADYWLVRRLGRPEATWATFPLFALLLAGLAFALGGRFKDARLRLNQVDVVDWEWQTGLVRGTTWLNIYSPENSTSDWSVRPPPGVGPNDADAGRFAAPPETLVSWQGTPGRGVGALGSSASAILAAGSYRTVLPSVSTGADASLDPLAAAHLGRLGGLPIPVAGTRLLSGRWQASVAPGGDVDLRSETIDGQLVGRLENPWSIRLSDWALLHGNWMYRAESELPPGGAIEIDARTPVRYLDWHLTRRRVSSENKDVTTPWDEQSLDLNRIVEMMLFHGSAGGANYTRIGGRYQGYLDLTDHLRLGRAVLVGRGPQVCQPLRDGLSIVDAYDRQTAFYRVVLPVRVGRVPAGGRPAP